MSLLHSMDTLQLDAMTARDFIDLVVASIKTTGGAVLIRTNYESAEKTEDLWLHVTPLLIARERSNELSQQNYTPSKPGVH